jgi:predicted RNA binding protein YcfA (HicA-like mRNA interferase family)
MKPIGWHKFHKFLLSVGCTYKRKKGSHRIYSYPDIIRPIVVPEHNTPVPVFIVKNNLRLLGISEKEYLEKIKEL